MHTKAPVHQIFSPYYKAGMPFQGKFATTQARQKLLNDQELKAFLSEENDPYIENYLPDVFFDKTIDLSHQKQTILKRLDSTAKLLSQIDVALYKSAGFDKKLNLPPMELDLGSKKATLTYAGSGNFGSVFKLSIGQEQFAFKAFFKRDSEFLFSGPYNESALGCYITAKNVRNMPHLIAANPQNGWIMSEFIDENFENPHFEGPKWQNLDMTVFDPFTDNELKDDLGNKYRVDYGHLSNSERKKPALPLKISQLLTKHKEKECIPLDEYWDLFTSCPELRSRLIDKLICIAPENRLNVINKALHYPETKYYPIHDFFKADALSEKDILPLFNILLKHPDKTVRARAIFASLPEDKKQELYSIWNKRPEFIPFLIYLGHQELLPEFLSKNPYIKVK